MDAYFKDQPVKIQFTTYKNGNTAIIIDSEDYGPITATSPGKSAEPIIHPLLCEFHDWDDYDDIIKCLVEADLITPTVYFSYPFLRGNIHVHALTKKGKQLKENR